MDGVTVSDIAEIVDGGGLNLVVLCVSAEEFNEDHSLGVKDIDDQTVLIAFDIEDDTIAANGAGRRIPV